jgi:hypothetical protein
MSHNFNEALHLLKALICNISIVKRKTPSKLMLGVDLKCTTVVTQSALSSISTGRWSRLYGAF